MRIGMGLVGFRQGGVVDRRFLALTLAIKHLLWPALIVGIIWIVTRFFGLLHRDLYQVMFAFAIVPLAGITVTLVVLLKAHPEKAALAVLLSTLVSIVPIPFMLAWYGMERGRWCHSERSEESWPGFFASLRMTNRRAMSSHVPVLGVHKVRLPPGPRRGTLEEQQPDEVR